ncbi:probable group 1 truncated hemoglobin GlbN at C-terminar half [Coccomyxa sp. Obi]|nr:probable group 1 truncated hemoglobin GlbN at C-terminar half [Coccomyxa sp. Obi]
MTWCFTKGHLPLYQAGGGEKKKKPTRPGGAGTTKLATLRDDESWVPWKNYWLCTLFAIHGRAFPIAPMGAYSCWVVLVVVIIEWRVDDFSKYKELLALQYPVQTIGLALFLLLTFRTQTAYDRWWDGRKAWAGVINHTLDINRIASMGGGFSTGNQAHYLDHRVCNRTQAVAALQSGYVRGVVHSDTATQSWATVSDTLTIGEIRKMMAYDDLPLFAISQASDLLVKISRTDSKAEKMMVEADKRMNRLLGEVCACLRIRNTPMPWAYVVHLRAFLVLWLLILPLAFISTLHWYSIPLCILVGYELLGYEEIGVEIENPFGGKFNHLPLEGLTATIFTNAQHFLRRIKEREVPDKPAAMASGATLNGRTQSAAQLKDHDKSEVQLKERSQSAVAAAHVLDNKEALKCMTQHHQEQCQRKLYDRLGGLGAVQAAVDIFYKKVLGDVRVAHFFSGISMERLKAKQVKFLTYALGGEDEYIGKDPTVSHRRLHNEKGLRVMHFHIVVGHLQDTLRELGVAEALIDECTAVLAPMEKTFVCGDDYPCIGHKPERQDSAKVIPATKAVDDGQEQREACPF